MDEPSDHSAARLLLKMTEFGHTVSTAMAEAVGEPELVGNTPILVLSSLDLHGPQRPRSLQALTGLSSGGLSKLLDRMEDLGVVRRGPGAVRGDRRGVLVSLTDRGASIMKALTAELEHRLPETKALIQEVVRILDH